MIIDQLFESPQQCPECGGISFSDLILAEKKDACYHKVKASAKVWPSAYASGRLVQCRKKGAANYGNKSEGVAEAAGLYGPFTVTINTGERPQSRTKTKKFRREDDAILWAQDWLEDAPQYVFATAEVTDSDGNVVWTTDEQGMAEDDDAVAAFMARGGEIQRLKPAKPRKGERWQGSAHIGAAGGRGTKGRVSGLGANTGKSGKPVVTAEDAAYDPFANDPAADAKHEADVFAKMKQQNQQGKGTKIKDMNPIDRDQYLKNTNRQWDDKTQRIVPATKPNVQEVSLGDYRKKATVNKALAQTNKFFGRDDPAAVAAADRTIAKRERGLGRADARRQPYTAPPVNKEKQRQQLTDKYPNIDQLVSDAEKNRDPYYDRAEGNAYYAGREAEQNYVRLKQIQRIIQGLNEETRQATLNTPAGDFTADITKDKSTNTVSAKYTDTAGALGQPGQQHTATRTAGVGFGGASGPRVGKNYVTQIDKTLADYMKEAKGINSIRNPNDLQPLEAGGGMGSGGGRTTSGPSPFGPKPGSREASIAQNNPNTMTVKQSPNPDYRPPSQQSQTTGDKPKIKVNPGETVPQAIERTKTQQEFGKFLQGQSGQTFGAGPAPANTMANTPVSVKNKPSAMNSVARDLTNPPKPNNTNTTTTTTNNSPRQNDRVDPLDMPRDPYMPRDPFDMVRPGYDGQLGSNPMPNTRDKQSSWLGKAGKTLGYGAAAYGAADVGSRAWDYYDQTKDIPSVKEAKKQPPEEKYGPEYDDMVARVKKLAGLGPMRTVYDPAKRVYRNVPTAQQPKK